MGKTKSLIILATLVFGVKYSGAKEIYPSFAKSRGDFYVMIDEPVVKKGLLRATLTFATGYMPANKLNNLYLTGNVEYYTDKKISLRGDGNYFFNSMNGDKTLKQNHSFYGGAAYHFAKGNFDPFVGLQTGLALTQCGIVQQGGPERAVAYNPLISPIAGFNYYASRWFHLFINARYNIGKHLADDAIIPLNELSFSFGLGFNINTSKRTINKQ
ncbi:MAG TPA: hypothetical protein VGF30_16330 [Bacteroidia bacterium]